MFGLMLFGAIIVWITLSVAVAIWLGNKISSRTWRIVTKVLLVPFIFFVPVADEIIAWPEMQSLCEQKKLPVLGANVNEITASARKVQSQIKTEFISLSTGVRVLAKRHDYFDVQAKELVLTEYYELRPIKSWFAYPDAGGSRHTWILKNCDLEPTNSPSKKKYRQEHLGFKEIPQ